MEAAVAALVAVAAGWGSLQAHAHDYATAQVQARASQVAGASTDEPVDIVTVSGMQVSSSIADSVSQLLAAAKAEGIVLTGTSYRSRAVQIQLRIKGCGSSQFDIYQKPESACTPPTAIPGTSLHEKGLAIDFWNTATRETPSYRWLSMHAAAFGLHNRADEAWHWSTTGL